MKSSLVPILAACAALVPLVAQANDESTWQDIKAALFEGREIQDGTDVLALDAPYRAHDAAVVPIGVQSLIAQDGDVWVKTVHLIIDENPAPVAGVFHMTPEVGDASVTTRVRVDTYTHIRAIAETSDGELHMVKAFVKAAGGCSAPSTKDHEAAMARLGKMQFKQTAADGSSAALQGKLMISHPNYSGLQIDQLTRYWIPPDYVRNIEISLDGQELMTVESDISFSEDPTITFNMASGAGGTLSVAVEDSEGRQFEQSWPVGPAS